jgi:hypothetical protein
LLFADFYPALPCAKLGKLFLRDKADEEECVKRIDKAKKTTVIKPDQKRSNDEETSKTQKKTAAARGRGKTNSQQI